MKRLFCLLAGILFALVAARPADAASDQQEVIDRSMLTVLAMKSDESFGNSLVLIKKARAVMVVPQLVKGGFFFGGEGGSGVLMVRDGGGWSNPAFYTVGAASFGLQIGIETAEVVFFVMSEKALNAWMKNEVKLGAKAGLTVLVVGANAEAAATTNANVDVIAWARSRGAYAGITLEGSLIKPRDSYNTAYYGRALTTDQITRRRMGTNKGADALRDALVVP